MQIVKYLTATNFNTIRTYRMLRCSVASSGLGPNYGELWPLMFSIAVQVYTPPYQSKSLVNCIDSVNHHY